MRVAAFTLTRDRLDYTKRTVESMRDAGPDYPYAHYFYDQGSTDGTVEWLMDHFGLVTPFGENRGQHVASNIAHAAIMAAGYDLILRIDNDVEFKTKRWLSKLVRAAEILGHGAVIAPRIRGLRNPPPTFAAKSIGGMRFSFVEILGGACRLMPAATMRTFRFNERMPLAIGEAATLSSWLMQNKVPMAYAEDVLVKHMDGTDKQEATMPAYFTRSFYERHIPYGL